MPLNNTSPANPYVGPAASTDPSQTYQGPPMPAILQNQIDSHDPTQAIENLQKMGSELVQKYGPAFKKYIDKAVQTIQNQAKNLVKPNQDSKGVDNQHAMQEYAQIRKSVSDHGSMITASGKLINQIYNNQLRVRKEFERFVQIDQNLSKFVSPNGDKFLSNDTSNQLLDNLKDSQQKIDNYIQEIQKGYETAFDEFSKVMVNNSTVSPSTGGNKDTFQAGPEKGNYNSYSNNQQGIDQYHNDLATHYQNPTNSPFKNQQNSGNGGIPMNFASKRDI